MACSRQACSTPCLMCAYHIPTYSFYVRISAGSTVSGLTNGFSNPLVCWKFFQPPVFEAQAKNVLKHKHSLRLLSVSPPAVIVCFDWLTFPWLRERAQIMRCQAGQPIIVNYVYSSTFGMQPWCFQEYKVVSSTCSRFGLLNASEWSVLKFNK